jgi:transaldolase
MMCAAHISAPARTSLHKEDPVKFFLDTADLDEIEEAASWGAIAGVTTNPSLYSRIGGKLSDFNNHIKRICDIVGPDCPVSAESVAMDREGIIRDGRELAAIAPNVVVKVPTMVEGLAATRVLANEGIPVNMTLCFSVPQAILAARAGARYISPFIGRFDDISEDGLDQVANIVTAIGNYDFTANTVNHEQVEIIAASVRSANHVTQCALMGADIATVPFAVLKKMVEHPLTDRGLKSFLKDWEKVQNA